MEQTSHGVVYMLLGDKHAVQLAVSVRSLRRVYDGPISIFVGKDDAIGEKYATLIAEASGSNVVPFTPKRQRRHSGYASKPRIPKLSPYRHTLQLDADTLVLAPFDELWPRRDEETVLTPISDWVSNGRRIAGRLRKWEHVAPAEVANSLQRPYLALNTGVLAYGSRSRLAREAWLEMTMRQPDIFMSDELAMQLIYPDHFHVRVLDDRFNWSAIYPASPREDARILHMHGRKAVKHPNNRAIWWPEFLAAWREDYAGLRGWCPAGDKRLRQYLDENPGLLV